MRFKKIISLSLALLTGISVLPVQLFAASSGRDFTTDDSGKPSESTDPWSNSGTSSVISQGDIYYLEKNGSSVYPEKYIFKSDGSDGDGIQTNIKVVQDGKLDTIVPPWEQFYDGLTKKEKEKYILVRDKISITKKDKSGKPLEGIKFQIDKKDVCTTDQDGKCTITFTDNKWGPIDLIEEIPTDKSGKPKYKSKTIKLYRDPGTRFLGEVSGNKLGITYGDLRKYVKDKTGKGEKPSITESESKEIYGQNEKEENVGGMWLKFIDRDQFGKIHVFYVAKKPILKNINWDTIYSAGMVYGWDVIDSHTEKPKKDPEKYTNNGASYKATILEDRGGNNKFIVRLPRGLSNYGDFDTKKHNHQSYNTKDAPYSEWNRTILPLTKQYRIGLYTNNNTCLGPALRDGNDGESYVINDYKIQTARYNWFGDLTLGASNDFIYNSKDIDGVEYQGQWNWAQEHTSGGRSIRGKDGATQGAATSYHGIYNTDGDQFGFRPVLEVAPKEYDGVVFEGEVTGNELGITYNDLRKEAKKKAPDVQIPEVMYSTNAEKIIDQNKYEEVNGGMWLKFTDYKYTRNGRPRVFYVAKKPILKNISWNHIHSAGMVYGWDVINPDTKLPRSNSKKYENNGRPYKAYMKEVNGKKYITRLLQGKTNYGGDVTNQKIYRDNNDNNNSEWNRVILPLVQGYRFGSDTDNSNYSEDLLRQSDGNIDYYLRKYITNTAQYNWFGDLTLGARTKFQYGRQIIDNRGSGTGPNGQNNWTQEYSYLVGSRSRRGKCYGSAGAALSDFGNADYADSTNGFRPVLEPLDN